MPVYTVSQVARYIRDSLDGDSLLGDVWVNGEVSNLSRSVSGHCYFTLKDAASQLRCVLFRNGQGSEHLADGVALLAHGRISFYEVRGDLQFYVDLAQPEGVGLLHAELERLKKKLQAEGLFDETRKRPIPRFPNRIAVVTSPVGAVWHDIRSIVERRYPLVELVLVPTPVQGASAAGGIVDAFQVLSEQEAIDTVIVARGGGSLEELWPFNEEAVARAIYGCKFPVISAVGHHTDYTIADLVADLRAPTPSAAAELAVPDRAELASQVLRLHRALLDYTVQDMSEKRHQVEILAHRLQTRAPDTPTRRQRVDDLLREASIRLSATLAVHQERVQSRSLRLEALSPRAVLERGYAVAQKLPSGEVITSPQQVAAGEALQVTVSGGPFKAVGLGQ
ncbi:MAG: exodeoxyribonuclease VII large subunit [Chloroflexi bacterium]|nr:exodeoxyribonuclease VII large subunit [Chloroflexota bacterium]